MPASKTVCLRAINSTFMLLMDCYYHKFYMYILCLFFTLLIDYISSSSIQFISKSLFINQIKAEYYS